VKIEDLYYLTYTAYDGVNALGALAVSKDLIHWDKTGLIVPQMTYDEFSRLAGTKAALNEKYLRYNKHEGISENKGKKVFVWDKNVIFFPRKINGKLYFLHRVKPDIQIVAINNLQELTVEFWQHYFLHLDDNIVLCPKYDYEVSYIGGGCPPLETAYGWLLIYHGVHDTVKGYVYSACVALLDLEDPRKEIARLPYALFKPEHEWELKGEVNNVCFPTGAVLFEDTLYIYYGAADEQIACASVSVSALIKELIFNKYQKTPCTSTESVLTADGPASLPVGGVFYTLPAVATPGSVNTKD
jgi:predicted GH43/DUF377 family glycosyl hydrolase